MKSYGVIIVGEGPSGIVSAICAARKGKKVLILDKQKKHGHKLLATGNGKCNFTNLDMGVQKYVRGGAFELCEDAGDAVNAVGAGIETSAVNAGGSKTYNGIRKNFVESVLSQFGNKDAIRFFEELGVLTYERDGYVYPSGEQSSAIVDALVREMERLKIDIIKEALVFSIEKKAVGSRESFIVSCNVTVEDADSNGAKGSLGAGKRYADSKKGSLGKRKGNAKSKAEVKVERFSSEKLVLACGGFAGPQFGCSGDGYGFAESFGHNIIKPCPALTSLKLSEDKKILKDLKGVRFRGCVTCEVCEDNTIAEQGEMKLTKVCEDNTIAEQGEMIFTETGISGIPIFQISSLSSKHIHVNFLPGMESRSLEKHIKTIKEKYPEDAAQRLFVGVLHEKLAAFITKKAGVFDKKCKTLTDTDVMKMCSLIADSEFGVVGPDGFEKAQVTAGGVDVSEISVSSMESKLCANLFVTGELLDVDGICGGYNLQWAWSTGYICGNAI